MSDDKCLDCPLGMKYAAGYEAGKREERARIANLEAARAETFEQFLHMAKVALEQQRRAEKAEAELG